jgi:hypothetical protein
MLMLQLRITRQEIGELRRLQAKRRWDRLIPFSVNCHKRTWAFETWGLTPEEIRREVGGLSEKLDVIAEEYLRVRESGGRFFVNRKGAFYKDAERNPIPFVTFPE